MLFSFFVVFLEDAIITGSSKIQLYFHTVTFCTTNNCTTFVLHRV